MEAAKKKMKPIWYFVGLILMIMGLIIFINGIFTSESKTALAYLRPNIWWSGVMIISGAIIFLTNRKKYLE